MTESHRKWIARNPDKFRLWRRKTRAKKRLEIRALINGMKNVPCADCNGKFDPCVMDFDHIDPSKKKANIGVLARRSDMKHLMEEISKCEIVCANCHRLRTKRKGHYFSKNTTPNMEACK